MRNCKYDYRYFKINEYLDIFIFNGMYVCIILLSRNLFSFCDRINLYSVLYVKSFYPHLY